MIQNQNLDQHLHFFNPPKTDGIAQQPEAKGKSQPKADNLNLVASTKQLIK